MRIFKGIDSIINFGATTIAVGSFDGVHSGHASLLRTLRERATQAGRKSVVVSFSPHPRVALGRAEGLKLLTSESEKAELLAQESIDALLLIEFNREFSRLSYEEFLLEYLLGKAGMAELVVGFNNHLGHNAGGYDKLREVAASNNFEIHRVEEFSEGSEEISSTTIRALLESGDIESANRLLAHPYLIIGVADGRGQIAMDEPLKLIPPAGRYCADIDGEECSVTVDSDGGVWCSKINQIVNIKLKHRYEE